MVDGFQCDVVWDNSPPPPLTLLIILFLNLFASVLPSAATLCYWYSSFLCYCAICLCLTRVSMFDPAFDMLTQARFSVRPPNQLCLIQCLRPHLLSSPSAFVTKPNYYLSFLLITSPILFNLLRFLYLFSHWWLVSFSTFVPFRPFISYLLNPASAPLSSHLPSAVRCFLAVSVWKYTMEQNSIIGTASCDAGLHTKNIWIYMKSGLTKQYCAAF